MSAAAALGRDWLAANLPHQGRMNLLDRVVAHDEATIQARATGHRASDNPLRRDDALPVVAAIEYGAQAAAAHGALVAGRPSGAGFLAAVRAVRFHARRLDDLPGDLEVRAERLGGGDAGVVYRFEVSSGGRALAEGRLTVAFAR